MPTRRPQRVSQFSYRRPRLDQDAARAAALAPCTLAAVGDPGKSLQTRAVPRGANRRRRPRRRGWLVLLLLLAAAAVGVGVAVRHEAGTRQTAVTLQARTTPAKAGQHGSGPTPKTNVVGAVHARTFGWAAVPRATAYAVTFFRGRQPIFEAHPSAPRVVLPTAWRYHGRRMSLTAGRYTWVVRPLFGPQGHVHQGRYIVRADFALKR